MTSKVLLRTQLIVAIVAAAVFLLTSYSFPLTSDDAATLATVAALGDKGTLAISNMQWLDDRVDIGMKGPDGNLYSKYGIGLVLASWPLYQLGRLIPSDPYQWAGYVIAGSSTGARLALLVNALLGAALVFATGRLVQAIWGRAGIITSVVLACASPVFLASRSFGSEIGTALCLVLAIGACWHRHLYLGILLVCIAALFRPVAIVFSAAWVIFLWKRPFRQWLLNAAVLGVGLLILAGFNLARYGSATQTGYAGESGFTLQFIGLAGYLVSPGRSIMIFLPVTLLVIAGIVRLWKSRDLPPSRIITGTLLGTVVFIVVHAMWREWQGGYAYGPRLLIPVIPFIVALAAPYLTHWIALPLIWFGSFVQLITLSASPVFVLSSAVKTGITFEQSVWSFQASPIVLQTKTLSDSANMPVVVTLAIAAIGLLLVQALIRKQERSHMA